MVAVTSFVVATAALGVSVAGAFGVSLAAGGFAAFAVGLGTNIILGAALSALTPKPSTQGTNRGYQTNTKGSAQDHAIIYGKVRSGGAIVYDESTGSNNKFLHRVIAFAGHEVDSFDEIYIDDEVATLDGSGNVTSPSKYKGKIRINKHLGAADQSADSDLVNESNKWSNQHRLRGIAYLYVRLEYDADAFPNGIPTFTSTIKGKKVYDPRTGNTVWSDNPALCTRDYLTSKYGVNEATTNIDDTLVITAANICDQTNTNAGTARYTCNGAFTTATTPYSVLGDIITSMGGLLWYAQGKWRMKPAYWTAPVMTLDENDLRSGINVTTRHSRRDNFNVVKGTFRGEESNWQVTDYPQVTNSAYLDADNGQESVADVNLSFTDTSVEARRLALITLESNRQQLTVKASFGVSTLQVQVGDNVKINNTRFGWTNKEFQVINWTFGLTDGLDLQVEMTLRETSESVFDEVDDGVVYERDNTNLPNPFFVEGVGISAVASVQISNQKVSNIALVNITATDGVYIDSVNVEYKLSSESIYKALGTGTLGFYEAVNLEPNFYDFRARAINIFGVKGEWTYLLNKEINAFAGDPSDVIGFDIEISGGTIFLSWEPISDPDLSHYEIKHNSNTSGANWGSSTTVIEKVARPASSATLPARSGTFLIRSYDKEGNFSVGVSTIVVLPSELPSMGQTEFTADQEPTFTGTKTNAIVVSSALEIDITTSSSPTGEYFFPSYIDVGTVRSCIVTGFRTFTRKFDGGTLLWDDIPQDFDTWPDLFDTWTTETTAFGDTGVTVFASATYDDPAGTPTWGSYLPANGASIMGRAFRFKAELNSSNAKYTPSITELSASVAY